MATARLQDAFKRQAETKSDALTPKTLKNLRISNRTVTFSDEQSGTQDNGQILVAVDFGTTFSSVAWLHTSAGKTSHGSLGRPRINIIQDWPGTADARDNVPSVLQYSNGKIEWGVDIDESQKRYQWFKLEQDPKYRGEKLKSAYPPMTIEPEDDQHAKDLITGYLKKLREHVEGVIKSTLDLGGGRLQELLRGVRWEYIITVPAMWPESAQSITEKCAREAGMAPSRPVQIIAEPEAAGMYALDEMSQELNMSVGDTFVICDAGGGTVDLISYTITKLTPSLELEEAAAGTGSLCGSSFLDRAFITWLKDHMKNCRKWNVPEDGYLADAAARWETVIKRDFAGKTHKKYMIPARGIPDDNTLHIKGNQLQMPGAKVKELFEPVISKILKLVRGQIETVQSGSSKTVNAVLLAGGFGRNEYLRAKIQREVGSGIKVKRMKDCTTAIVRGALIRGLADRSSLTAGKPTIAVGSRLLRRHYGIQALQRYSQGYHDSRRPRYPGGADGGERIDVMEWWVKKNTRIKDFQNMEFEIYYDQAVDNVALLGRLGPMHLPIYTCDDDNPPDYPETAETQPKKRKYRKLAVLTAELNKIPKKLLKKEMGDDNQLYYKVPFKIIMSNHLANVKFRLDHNGVEYDAVSAAWEMGQAT